MENLVDRVDQDGAMTDFGRGKFEARVDFLRRGLRKKNGQPGKVDYFKVMDDLQQLIQRNLVARWDWLEKEFSILPFSTPEEHISILEARAKKFGGLMVPDRSSLTIGVRDVLHENIGIIASRQRLTVIIATPKELGFDSRSSDKVKFVDVMRAAPKYGLAHLSRAEAPQATCRYTFKTRVARKDPVIASVSPEVLKQGIREVTFAVFNISDSEEPYYYKLGLMEPVGNSSLHVPLDQQIVFRLKMFDEE